VQLIAVNCSLVKHNMRAELIKTSVLVMDDAYVLLLGFFGSDQSCILPSTDIWLQHGAEPTNRIAIINVFAQLFKKKNKSNDNDDEKAREITESRL